MSVVRKLKPRAVDSALGSGAVSSCKPALLEKS